MGSAEQAGGERRGPLELVVFAAGDEAIVTPLPAIGRVSIGRGEGNDVRIEDPSVSRRHAVLHVADVIRVEDTGSANGTFVRRREERTSAETRKVLRMPGESFVVELGDCILLGSVVAVVRRARAAVDEGAGDEGRAPGERVIVQDPAMRVLHEQARTVARSSITVLLLGETGVGKEVLARAIHEASPRVRGPFVAIHCASLSESLLESELFGHKKGSFTGATEDKKGLFEVADGGTLFLDEIGELSPSVQVKLLRVLEERAVLRIGERAPRSVDVRFVAATNRDLETEVAKGTFRNDLFYRLSGAELTVPPLRERPTEIVPLAMFFLAEECKKIERVRPPKISPDAAALLERHAWPGNVRELKNAMDRAAVLCVGDVLAPEHLPTRIAGAPKPRAVPAPGESSPLPAPSTHLPTERIAPADVASADKRAEEKRRMMEVLDLCAGNQTRAAEMLGMSRRTFVTRLEEYDLPRPRKKP
jgi:two-component system, NtrC family, response regulator AtoC